MAALRIGEWKPGTVGQANWRMEACGKFIMFTISTHYAALLRVLLEKNGNTLVMDRITATCPVTEIPGFEGWGIGLYSAV